MNAPRRRRKAVWVIPAAVAVCLALGASLTLAKSLTQPSDQSGGIRASAFGLFAVNRVEVKESPRPVPDDKPAEDSIKAIQKLLDDQAVAWNKGDLEGFMAGYWNSPDLSFYSGRDTRKGWKETHDRYQDRYKKDGREMGKLTFSELRFDPLAPETVMVRGRWKLILSKENPDGLFTLIVQKKAEGWRIVHDHTSIGESEKKP
jgi:ketosteroid isomerase-like protein